MRFFALLLLPFACLFVGCPSAPQVKKDNVTTPPPDRTEKPLPRKTILPSRIDSVPANTPTRKVVKGLPIHGYLMEDGTIQQKFPTHKNWKMVRIPNKGKRSWFLKLDPNGQKLGSYVVVHVAIAVYSGMAGYGRSAFFSARFLLRRGGKEIELFRSMIRCSGSRYQIYRLINREIPSPPDLKPGDVLVFRLVHKKGSNGVVGIGGGTGFQGSQIVVSPVENQNYYKFTK